MRSKKLLQSFLNLTLIALVLVELSCSSEALKKHTQNNENSIPQNQAESQGLENTSDSKVIKKKELDAYNPQKREYNFYFTYKIVHAWWDAVALGSPPTASCAIWCGPS